MTKRHSFLIILISFLLTATAVLLANIPMAPPQQVRMEPQLLTGQTPYFKLDGMLDFSMRRSPVCAAKLYSTYDIPCIYENEVLKKVRQRLSGDSALVEAVGVYQEDDGFLLHQVKIDGKIVKTDPITQIPGI